MAPPPPTAPLSPIPLAELSEFSSPLAFHGGFSLNKHTIHPDTAATISSKLYVQSSHQYVSTSSATRPPPTVDHTDSNLPSASSQDSLFPHTILPPLSWPVKPLTVRVLSPPLSPCAQPSPTSAPTHSAASASLPPSSRLAARHHPPLLRHLVDRSLPPPSCVDWPQFISSGAPAAERPVTTAAERRRLSAPAAADHHRHHLASNFRVGDASTGFFTEAHNVENGPRLAVAENAPDGRGVTHPVTSHTSSAESDSVCALGPCDTQRACNFKQVLLATCSTDAAATGASRQDEVRASRRRREGTPLGPLLRHLLTPQTGPHCPVHAERKDEQYVQQWRRPTVLLPPFFSSPAALQRSENTLQSELASSVLRCRAAELRQQRLLQIAAAVVHQGVRVHASRIVDIIELHGTAAASACRAALPVEVPGMRLKPERRPGTVAEDGPRMAKASSREADDKVTFTTRYYDWLCGSAELNSCSSSSERGVLQCLPVIVAPAGADVADHRLAVHGLLRECLRRCHRDSSADLQTAAGCTPQRANLFLRLAVIRPSHCSSVGKAMHAIYEQITQIPLSSRASPAEKSGVEVVGRSRRSQQEVPVQKSGSWNSSREPLHSDRSATLHSFAKHNLHAGNNGLFVCYDGGAAAAWGESTWTSRRSANAFSADEDASLLPCIEAGQYDEVEVAAELQQLNGTDMWGAAAGASDAGLLRRQEEFWEIENEAEAAVVLGACHTEHSTCGGARRRSCHHDTSQGQMRTGDFQRQMQSVHQQQYAKQQQQQQQRVRKGQPDAEQRRRDYGASQQPVGCNNLPFLSGTSCSGTAHSYVRRSGESDNVCVKLACWWAAQQLKLLQRSSERCSDGGIAAAAAAAAPACSPSRHRTGKQARGETCASWAVRTRAASTHLRNSTAAEGNFPSALFETHCDEEGKRQHERTSERSAEEGKRENREEDAAEEATTTDEESNDEQDLQKDTRMLLGSRGEIAAKAAAPPAGLSPGWNRSSRVNTMQPAAIVIVFEEAEAFPGGLLARLLQLLALLRQQLSLPFVVVATASTNATVLQQLCDSPLSSSCCVTVEPATLLQPARVQQQLLQLLLCCPAALPFTLPLAVAEKLLQSIEETSPSALQLLRRLQLLLRLFYQHHPLAFLCRDLDGVTALMGPQYYKCAPTAATHRQQQQQYSSSSNTEAHAAAARFPRSSCQKPLLGGAHEEEEAKPKREETQEEKSRATTQNQQFLQHSADHNNSRDAGQPAYDIAAGRAKTASPAAKDLDDDLARELHALHVVKQLRRRVELLAFASLTGDHVHMLRQLLRHTNEVLIHLTAAQQEGLFFFDRCCWQQVRLQRQHRRRSLLAAVAAASNGAAFSCSSSSLPPLQRDAAASTLALRCRPEEDGEQQKQQQQCSKSSESGGSAAAGGGFSLLEAVAGAACAAEDYTRRKAHWGCHRLAGCVARRSTLGLLKSWWGSRGLLLLQKVEEEEKQQKLQQQQKQVEQKHLPSASTATGFSQATRGGGDTQGDLLPLKLKLLCKEVLPAASIELLQRRVGYCMAYRLLFVLQQQLQRYRRLASAAATDAEAAATAGSCGGGFVRAAEAGRLAGDANLPAGGNNTQQEEAAAAEEEDLLLRIAAEEEANSNCRQTIETLDLLVGAHEEFSCLLRKCKPRARVQEMAKACFAVEQDVRRVVVSLFEQFAVAAPVRVSAAAAATRTPEPLADPAALALPLKLFRAQVKREARLLRVLAAAGDAQQRREQQLACAGDGASSMDAAAGAATSHASVKEQACELQQQQLPFSNQASTHAYEVVRVLDTLDALIWDLSKAAAPAVPAPDPAGSEAAAAAGCAAHRGVEQRTLSGACKSETASSGVPANTKRRGGKESQNDIYSNKKEAQDAEATAGQHKLARSSSHGAGLTISGAAARQKRRQTQGAADALRALLSVKRKFLRWVEEALLLLLLPLPGWHPLGGELAVWGGALGFEVAAAVQFPPEGVADPPAAADCPRLFSSSAGNTGPASQKRYTAGTVSGTLAAAADLVCSSFEAAPQTETLQHAAMGSTSFLQRFSVPLEEEGEEEKEGEEDYRVEALPQQQKQKRQLQLQQLSRWQEEASLQPRTEADREVRKGKGTERRGDKAEQQEEDIKLEDVAIVLRLVNGAGRRINLWDLFCAFCRDLLKNRIKKKKIEIQKKLQRRTYGEKGGKLQCSWPDNVSSNSSSPQPDSSTDSVSQKWSSQRQKKRHTRVSESDIEEEVLRLMEAESCSLHADTAECSKNTGLTSGPPHPKECHQAPKNLTGEDSQRQKAASSRMVQADLLYAKRTSHISRSPLRTPRGSPVSHTVAAAASPAADASTDVRASLAAGADFAADSLSAAPTQLPGSVGGERVQWTLLQQLQLRFAVAVETLDQQLGVIRLPSAASAAAAVERVMLAEEGGGDAAVIPDFSVIPPGGEQVAGGDEGARLLVDDIEESEEDASEAEGGEEGEFPAARDAELGTEQEKRKCVEACKAGGAQVQDENTERPGTRYSRVLRSSRSNRRGLAACERERSAASPCQEQQEDIDENDVSVVGGDDMLMHELRTMRKLLRNVFARRTHFVSISSCPAKESGGGTVESGGSDVERFNDEEMERRSLRKKSCTSRRKSNRRSRKKVLL